MAVTTSLLYKFRHKSNHLNRSIMSLSSWTKPGLVLVILLLLGLIPLSSALTSPSDITKVNLVIIKADGTEHPLNRDRHLTSIANVSLPTLSLTGQSHTDLLTVALDDGKLYLGARNYIHRVGINSATSLVLEETSAPLGFRNRTGCPTVAAEALGLSPTLAENDFTVLFPLEGRNALFACSADNCGRCEVFKANNLQKGGKTFGAPETDSLVDFIGGRRSVLVFRGDYKSANMHYIAVEPDGRETSMTPPFFSARSIKSNHFVYTTDSGIHASRVAFHPQYRNTHTFKLLTGFVHNGYAYLVTIQPDSLNNATALPETRLARICENDINFKSYMELPLICRSNLSIGSEEYRIARTATLTQNLNTILAGKVEGVKEQSDVHTTLYVAFEAEHQSRLKTSPICAFNMEDIEAAFKDAATDCNYNGGRTELLETITGTRTSCTRSSNTPTDEELTCGSTSWNRYILGQDPVPGRHVFTLRNDLITSLGATSYTIVRKRKRSTVAQVHDSLILGTAASRLLKLDIKDYQFDSLKMFSQRDRSLGPFLPKVAYDPTTAAFYLLTRRSVTEVATLSCSIYTSCAACFRSETNCFWHGGACRHRDEIHEAQRALDCPPEVYSWSPKSGPIQGGTVISFYGTNFGNSSGGGGGNSDKNYIKISVGQRDCRPLDRRQDRLSCRVEDSDEADLLGQTEGIITIEAKDKINVPYNFAELGYNIEGNVTLAEPFTYKSASIIGAHPPYGPTAGGTRLTVYGQQLNIGSNITVMIDSEFCTVLARQYSYVICETPSLDDLNALTLITTKQIKVSIDSHNMVMNGDSMIAVDSQTIFNHEYDSEENQLILLKPKRKRMSFRKASHPFGRSILTYIELLRNQNASLNFSESFQYRPNPRATDIYDRPEEMRHTKFSDNFHTVASGQTILYFSGEQFTSVAYPMLDVTPVIGSNEQNTSSVLCERKSAWLVSCPIPALPPGGIQPTSDRSIEAKYTLHLDAIQIEGDKLNEPPKLTRRSRIVYHPDPVFTPFNSTVRVSTKSLNIELHGKYLHHDLPYQIALNDSQVLKCIITVEATSPNLLRCKLAIEPELLEEIYGDTMELSVTLGNRTTRIGNVMLHDDAALGAVSIVFIIIGCLLVVLLVAGFLYHRLQITKQKVAAKDNYTWSELQAREPKTLEEYFTDAYQNLDLFHHLQNMGKIVADPGEVQKMEISLGNGNFGIVHMGRYQNENVAIKMLKRKENLDFGDQLKGFFTEAETMKDFNHDNVLSLIAVTLVDEYPAILLPYMCFGDLASYVKNPLHNPSVRDLLDYSIQVAQGMEYLANRKFVHRDLAARNCLIGLSAATNKAIIKVADFGLSRQFEDKLYYRCNPQNKELPYRWMPIEALEGNTMVTSKSDVWSYGVLVWELITRGQLPYGSFDFNQVSHFLRDGRRLPQPSHCPELIYLIMDQCWYEAPEDRPDFTTVLTMMKEAFRLLHLQEANTYVNMIDQTVVAGANGASSAITFRPCPLNYTNANIKNQLTALYEKACGGGVPILPQISLHPNSEPYEDDDGLDDCSDEDASSSYPYAPPSYTAATALPADTAPTSTRAPSTTYSVDEGVGGSGNSQIETSFSPTPTYDYNKKANGTMATSGTASAPAADYSQFSNTSTLPR